MRDRVLGFQHRLEDRMAGRTEPCQGGVAIFRPDLPRVFDLNFLRVEKPPARGAAAIAAEADRLQGAAGLLHRRVVIDDEGAGEAMLGDFRELGWLVDRMLLMAHASPRPGAVEPPAELVDPAELLPAQELHIRNDPHDRSPEVLRQLLAAETARAVALQAWSPAVRAGREVVSWCLLYTAGGLAQIDEVTTLDGHRRLGYATAVMRAAIAHAGSARAGLVFLWADDRDWPKDWYARLGFEPVARRYAFVKRPS
jgi:GNAT superfamily N-acetyltransferase